MDRNGQFDDLKLTNENRCLRLKAKYCSGSDNQSYGQFCLDVKSVNFDSLLQLLSHHFCIKTDFTVNNLVTDKYGEQINIPIQSDMDLDVAVLTSSDFTLRLTINSKISEDWDVVGQAKTVIKRSYIKENFLRNALIRNSSMKRVANIPFIQNLTQHVERTVSSIEKAIGLRTDSLLPRPPVSDMEMKQYMDNSGRIVRPNKFFWSIFCGGLEPGLRRMAWRILLNIFPAEVTGKERISLLLAQTSKYEDMRQHWKRAYTEGRLSPYQLNCLTLASLDVLRTDRDHPFYANDSKNKRLRELFNIMVTYSIYHPSVGYYQGMSDIASPLLYVQQNEAAAYVCFCALMQRLGRNFKRNDNVKLVTQMQHLHDLLVYIDCELAQFLRQHNLGNMYFTERWLLLELKREFSFDNALYMSEIQWAALNTVPDSHGCLFEQSNSTSGGYLVLAENNVVFVYNGSMTQDIHSSTVSVSQGTRDFSLINLLVGDEYSWRGGITTRPESFPKVCQTSSSTKMDENYQDIKVLLPDVVEDFSFNQTPSSSNSRQPFESLCPTTNYAQEKAIEGDLVQMKDGVVVLAPPNALGAGHPFLLFLCVSMLLEYRDEIFAKVKDPSDLFHLFQQKNKSHNCIRIANRARNLFCSYLHRYSSDFWNHSNFSGIV